MSPRAGKSDFDDTPDATSVPFTDRALFLVLTAVLCARPLISESFERTAFSFLPEDGSVGPTPATTVWLDCILLLTAVLAWARRGRSRGPARAAGLGVGLLLAAVIVSVAAAHDRRLAANAGAHLLVMALAAAALVRVLRARWVTHLLIAAVLAGGVTNAVKCVTQRVYEFDESRKHWQEQEPARIAAGVDPDSPALINYERRLQSNEAFGHLSHPNVTASCLGMCVLVTVGLFVGLLRKRGVDTGEKVAAALVAGALTAVLAVGMWLTGSVGAIVAAALGGALLLGLGGARRWITGRTRGVFVVLVAAYVAVIAAGAGYGLSEGTLPHTSLAFRWEYWQAAARAVADAPLTGLGRENFRAAYLLHKSPAGTEEVSNAHDLWLSLLVELGPLGLLAGVLLIGSTAYGALRGVCTAGRAPPTAPVGGLGSRLALAAGVLLVQAIFSGTQFSAAGIPLLWAVLVAGVWMLAFVTAHSLTAQVDEDPRAAAWLSAALFAALCAAPIHNLIAFSLFTPAGLSVFVALAAGAIGRGPAGQPQAGRQSGPVGSRTRPAGLTIAALGLLLAAYAWFVATPTARMDAAWWRIAAELRAASGPRQAHEALRRGLEIPDIDRWDTDAPLRLGQTALQMAMQARVAAEPRQDWIHPARQLARAAVRRDPHSFAARQLLARVLEREAELTSTPGLAAEAAAQWEKAVALYPTNPRARIAAGRAWYRAWEDDGRPDCARKALEHLCTALEIDATRLPEVAAKLRSPDLRIIHALLEELRSAGFGSCETAMPESRPAP